MGSSDEIDFSPTTPLYHEAIDGWGLAVGTRVWMADGGFRPIQEVEEGDEVFGYAYRIETDYVERNPNTVDPTENLVKFWRPVLVRREVLGINTTEARAWELTFGTHEKQYEARRLVAGGETTIRLFPVAHDHRIAKPLVACHTVLDNPRVGSDQRKAVKLDREASQQAEEPRYQQTDLTGTPRGESAVIVPYDALGGQREMVDTDQKGYNRYNYTQVREIVPVPGMAKSTLYQLELQPDTTEDLGVLDGHDPRCNVIAQTPFAGESDVREVTSDPKAGQHIQQLNNAIESDQQDVQDEWDSFAHEMSSPEGTSEKHTTYRQGQFYDTKDGEKGEALSKHYNIDDGWLNGGILINLPVPDQYEKSDPDVAGEQQGGAQGDEDSSGSSDNGGPAVAQPA